jgi:nitrite reductase/ring-hydroxylating ferredoxin subunit
VCKESDIQENEMKQLPLGSDGKSILLIKQKGELYAIGTKCTHYGAPLKTGALGEGRVRCPWHGACFSIKTGDIEDYPGLDSIPCYKVFLQTFFFTTSYISCYEYLQFPKIKSITNII